MIDLYALGCGAMMPLPHRWLSSFLVRCRGEIILFDCGEGTQIPWQASGWGFRRVSAICLSHWHADHVAGLPGILHAMANSQRTDPVTIYGPVETARVVAGLRQIAPDLPFTVRVHELQEGDRLPLPGGLIASVIAGEHRVPSLIYRIDLARKQRFDRIRAEHLGVPQTLWSVLQAGQAIEHDGRTIRPDDVSGPARRGLSIGFMTDTRPVAGVVDFLREVDVLISEGTYGDSAQEDKAIAHKHMTFNEAATIARDAGVGRLWLTHFSPAMDDPALFLPNATSVFPNTRAVHTGLAMTLAFSDDDSDQPPKGSTAFAGS